MDNKTIENQLRYWRNTLADAARHEILVDKQLAIRNVGIDLHAGLIDLKQTAQLFEWIERKHNDSKGLESSFNSNRGVIDKIPVLIAPFRVSPVPEFARANRVTGVFYPFWIRAILTSKGTLQTDEDTFPYIPRAYLEPQVDEQIHYIFSSIDTVDLSFSKPFTFSQQWRDYWQYIDQTFSAITQQDLYNYQQENYVTTYEATLVINDLLISAADGIVTLYDSILRTPPFPALLTNLARQPYQSIKPLLSEHSFVQGSVSHLGQMSYEYALSISQRKSLYQVNQLNEGEILAVNGPPGTGKTTLIQSIVASELVKQAIAGNEPAIILACSTNNQAITNIIESFSNIKQKKGVLYKRWLPGLKSFGLFLASESKQVGDDILHLKRKKGGFLRDIENRDYVAQAEKLYINQFITYFNQPNQSVEQIIGHLQNKLKDGQHQLEEGARLWEQYKSVHELTIKLGQQPSAEGPSMTQINAWETVLKVLEEQVSTYLDNESFWIKIFAFLKPIKEKRAIRINQLFRDCPMNTEAVNGYNLSTVHAFFDRNFKLIKQIRELTNAWMTWKQANHVRGNPPLSDTDFRVAGQSGSPHYYDELEKGLKYDLFYLAVHYWEGRWILATRRALDENLLSKKGLQHTKDRWRRDAMLAPCFVSTFYTAPRFFTYSRFITQTNQFESPSPPLLSFIDLLIVDEAGQVSPEVGAASFALAKRSIVVGDSLQIEPVWNVPPKVDYANLVRHSLITTVDDFTAVEELLNKGFLSSAGSLIKLAQKSSAYQQFPQGERGMLLTEHRRCFNEIIDYCNKLAYGGLLEPMKGPAKDNLLPPMQFIETTGDSKTVGYSRSNEEQANQIADWIRRNQELILHHYQKQEIVNASEQNRAVELIDLSSILGIITPFTGQKQLIRLALQKAGINTTRLTIGTVHALQGAERPIILFSSTYGDNDLGKLYFFDTSVNMLNVGVSRAKEAFIFFGNRANFEGYGSTPSKQLYRHIQRTIN